jgi:hypothetical protein
MIADLENITMDQAWNLSTVHALNDLCYLKEFSDHESKLFKDARDAELQ